MIWHDKKQSFRIDTSDLNLDENARCFRVQSTAELEPIMEQVEGLMRALGFHGKDIFAVTLALHEAFTNAVRHGNRGNPAKYVTVSYRVTPVEVLAQVEDQGRGFDPNGVPNPLIAENLIRPGGRGLFLMRAYMSWVGFNREGNRVILCRRRTES